MGSRPETVLPESYDTNIIHKKLYVVRIRSGGKNELLKKRAVRSAKLQQSRSRVLWFRPSVLQLCFAPRGHRRRTIKQPPFHSVQHFLVEGVPLGVFILPRRSADSLKTPSVRRPNLPCNRRRDHTLLETEIRTSAILSAENIWELPHEKTRS